MTKGTVSIINRATRVNAHRFQLNRRREGAGKKERKKKFRDAFRFEFQTFVPFFFTNDFLDHVSKTLVHVVYIRASNSKL